MASKPTKLDELVEEAASVVVELEQLDGSRKLSYVAFLKEACEIAGCDKKRVIEVEQIIASRNGTDSIKRFIRKLSMEFREPRYVRPFPDASKAARVHGSEDLSGEMAQHGIKVGELQCVAIRACEARFGESVFGKVQSRTAHEKKTTELRQRLDTLHAEMRSACASVDLTYIDSYPAVLPSQKEAGLCKVSFVRAKDISPSMGDWPDQIIADAIAKAPQKRKREKLPKSKAA